MNKLEAKQAATEHPEIKKHLDAGWNMAGFYEYQNERGNPIYWRIRLDTPKNNESKWIRPFYFDGKDWVLQEPKFEKGKKPLYLLPAIKKSQYDIIYIVEGEKCADALSVHGILTTTSGSATSASNADWSCLAGRQIIIWSDNDDQGITYANNVTKLLLKLGCRVLLIDMAKLNLPPKGDCYDWLAANPSATKEDIESLLTISPRSQSKPFIGNIIPLAGNDEEQPTLPYPIECLPNIVKDTVNEYQLYGQQPLPMIACSALANMSLACQGLANISRDNQLINPLSLYIIVVAESGERKTATDNHFKKAAKNWEKEKRADMCADVKENKARHAVWQSKKKGILTKIENAANKGGSNGSLENQLIELEQQEPQKIIVPNLYNEETTTEALAYDLATGWYSTSLWSDEGGIVIGGHGMKQENVTKFTALLNRLWDGNEHRVSRKSSESFIIEGRRLTFSLMMQPAIFNQLLDCCNSVSRENGFLARCLIINPKSTMGTRCYKEPQNNMPCAEIFNNRICQLLNMPLQLNEQQRLAPKTLRLSLEAKNHWVEFYNEIEAELRATGDFCDMKDFAAKAADNAARIAGIFHVFCDENGDLIKLETMQKAIGIMAWHLQEIKRLMSIRITPQNLQDAKQLIDWIISKKDSEIKLADILRFAPSNLRDKQRRDDALTVLAEHNYLRIENRKEGDFIIINPKIDGDYDVQL